MNKRKSGFRRKEQDRRPSIAWQIFTGLLLLAGLLISVYLLWRHTQFATSGTAGTDTCTAVFGTGCDEALQSETSYQLGLPLAGWGTIYYGTLIGLLAIGRLLGQSFRREALASALLISIPALAASLVLAFLMLSGKAPFCPLCAILHTVNLLLVFVFWKLTAQSVFHSVRTVLLIFSSPSEESSRGRVKLLGIISSLLVGVALYLGVSMKTPSREASAQEEPTRQESAASFQEGSQQSIPIDQNDPSLGPYAAPAQIIVFSDFECPYCRAYSERLSYLKSLFGEQLQIIFKHFPLDISCNPIMRRDLHHFACEAAYAAEAARRQGKFWAFHDLLFNTPFTGEPGLFSSLAESAGLDITRFEEERKSQDVKAKVFSDIRLGMRLNVNSTPTLFLNGKRVHDMNPDVVIGLIEQELAAEAGR